MNNVSTTPNNQYYTSSRDGYWEFIGEMQAIGFEEYGYTAPTLVDSNNDLYASTFIVIAHTEDESLFFTSEPASGYSYDNLSPAVTQELIANIEDLSLLWYQVSDEDFSHYKLYRSEIEDANPDFFTETADTALVVNVEHPKLYYSFKRIFSIYTLLFIY